MAIQDTQTNVSTIQVEQEVKDLETCSSQVEMAEDTMEPLSRAHLEYLVERHGTSALDPVPSMDPADPLNLPTWKVGISGPDLNYKLRNE